MKNPYPIVSKKNPFFYVSIAGFDALSVTTTGDTKLQVYRVWQSTSSDVTVVSSTSLNMPPNYISPYNIPPYYSGGSGNSGVAIDSIDYLPIEQTKVRYTFLFDSQLFDRDGGRYIGDFYYKGTFVSRVFFEYDKQKVQINANV